MQSNLKNNTNFIYYNVYYSNYDENFEEDNAFTELRRIFFENKKPQKNKIAKKHNNLCYRYSYNLQSGSTMKWKKMIQDKLVGKSEDVGPNNYKITNIDNDRNLKVSYFDINHVWMKTEYFSSSNLKKPHTIIYPSKLDSVIIIDKYNKEKGNYNRIEVSPYEVEESEEEKNILNDCIGGPYCFCKTSVGDRFYFLEEQLNKRKAMLEKIRDDAYLISKTSNSNEDSQNHVNDNLSQEDLEESSPNNSTQNQEILIELPSKPKNEQPSYTYTNINDPNPIKDNENDSDISKLLPKDFYYTIETNTCFDNNSCPYKSFNKKLINSNSTNNYYFVKTKGGSSLYYGQIVNDNGISEYQGELLEDKKHGFGVSCNQLGKPHYVGNWCLDQKNGLGIDFIEDDNTIKVAKWNNGIPYGSNSYFDSNANLIFSGNIENGKRNGLGISYNAKNSNMFICKWENDIPIGRITEFNLDGQMVYNGGYENLVRSGFGIEYSKNDEIIYQGDWKNNKWHGNGTIFYDDHTYTGEFIDGKPCGKGTIYRCDGSYIEGKFVRWADANTKVIEFNNSIKYLLSLT